LGVTKAFKLINKSILVGGLSSELYMSVGAQKKKVSQWRTGFCLYFSYFYIVFSCGLALHWGLHLQLHFPKTPVIFTHTGNIDLM